MAQLARTSLQAQGLCMCACVCVCADMRACETQRVRLLLVWFTRRPHCRKEVGVSSRLRSRASASTMSAGSRRRCLRYAFFVWEPSLVHSAAGYCPPRRLLRRGCFLLRRLCLWRFCLISVGWLVRQHLGRQECSRRG